MPFPASRTADPEPASDQEHDSPRGWRSRPLVDAATLIAALGLVWGVWSYNGSMALQGYATAVTLHREYLALCIDNPDLAEGRYASVDSKSASKYQWFVHHALHTGEAVYRLTDGDPGWQATIQANLRPHRDYLRSTFDPKLYEPGFARLVSITLDEAGRASTQDAPLPGVGAAHPH